jgi:UPF0716 family protein affecting phage T7 exclusion
MIKGLLGVGVAALLFAIAIYLILHLLGYIAIIIGFLAVIGILAAVLLFIMLFAIGFVFFFAAFYYLIERKPTIQNHGNYKLSMEKGKGESDKEK